MAAKAGIGLAFGIRQGGKPWDEMQAIFSALFHFQILIS
jgi:hypothetical protein